MVLPFWEKLQFHITKKPSNSPFLGGDSQKKEYRTGQKQRKQGAVEVPDERGREGKEGNAHEQQSQRRLLAQLQSRS